MKNILSWLFIFLLFTTSCKQEQATVHTTESTGSKLGIVKFTPTGNEVALPHFEKGLLLLHNFEYDDARTAFLKAQAADSTMVMAYWGEAMTHNKPLWRTQKHEEGKEALHKLAANPALRQEKAKTELEKDLLAAVEILFSDEGEKKERDLQYKLFLEKLYKKYPGNHEVAAFYALSCLGAVKLGRDKTAYEEGARIAQSVIAGNPNHPGALHYLIHSYDDPEHASLALGAANSYSKVAADAPHALHMPSHIYVAVGMWDEVIASNIASWEAGQKQVSSKQLTDDKRAFHAYHWLMYGRTQKGQFAEARKIMESAISYSSDTLKPRTRSYFVTMKANYLMETRDFDGELAAFEIETEDLNIKTRAVNNFINGVRTHRANDKTKLSEIIKTMGKERAFAETLISEEGLAMCSSGGADRFKANRADVDRAHTMEMELRALSNWNNKDLAEDWLKKAVALEEATNYAFGPPSIPWPTNELYGKWLLENERYDEAITLLEKALERGPQRLHPMKMLALAYEKKADQEKQLATEKKLKELLKDADASLHERLLSSRF